MHKAQKRWLTSHFFTMIGGREILNDRIENSSDVTKNKWEERRRRLLECNERKRLYSDFEEWDTKFKEYDASSRFPAVKSKWHNWQMTQLGKGHSSLINRIKNSVLTRQKTSGRISDEDY